MAKGTAKKEMTMEEALWTSADKMRGSVEYPVYKQVFQQMENYKKCIKS